MARKVHTYILDILLKKDVKETKEQIESPEVDNDNCPRALP